ncbi:hypothetical protein EJ08DRAFT_650015 [Tothia fuscella]|uniref:Uncharacterized protein n=1 Tax=Tothia fuscella TaxID=1048955 RepID=A0A9P4NQ52_9PEZI|nr:hypothetical protein EJ08DRAFT_650015 [Tothia fuscella]
MFISDIFNDDIAQDFDSFVFKPEISSTGSSMDMLQAIYLGNFTNCATPDDKLQCAVLNMGRAISKSFRDAAYVASGFSTTNPAAGNTIAAKASMATGSTLVSVVFIN